MSSDDYSIAPTENSQGSYNSIDEWKQQQSKEEKYKKMLKSMKTKVKLYAKTLESFQDENKVDLSPVEERIYNEPMMGKIAKVEKLIGNYKFDELTEDNLDVLQLILLALRYNVIPTTLPQLEHLTDVQRKLPKLISLAEPEEAIELIKENPQELVNFFSVIKDSLKLVRKSFHKFPMKLDSVVDDESDNSMELEEL